MKYYVYISDTKVDMLYPQIPKPLLKRIASNLSIDLKLLGAEVSVGAKSSQAEETRYSKVRIVSEYIEKHLDVGTVDAPSTYFKGRLSMRQGTFKDQAVFFSGETAKTVLGLSGSMKHVIGNAVGSEIPIPQSSLLYAIEYMIRVVVSESKLIQYNTAVTTDDVEYDMQQDTLMGIIYLTKGEPGHKQQFEFLAKTLLQGQAYTKHYVVLGTPIYVAIDD